METVRPYSVIVRDERSAGNIGVFVADLSAQLRHLRQMIAPHPAKQPTAEQALAMAEFLKKQSRAESRAPR